MPKWFYLGAVGAIQVPCTSVLRYPGSLCFVKHQYVLKQSCSFLAKALDSAVIRLHRKWYLETIIRGPECSCQWVITPGPFQYKCKNIFSKKSVSCFHPYTSNSNVGSLSFTAFNFVVIPRIKKIGF